MKKTYDAPELEVLQISFNNKILGLSSLPTEYVPETMVPDDFYDGWTPPTEEGGW